MINKNIANKTASFDGFSGMDSSSPFGKGKTFRLENLRLLSDGSLEKREGYRHLASLPDTVRGVYRYEDGGEEVLLCVAGSYLCRVTRHSEPDASVAFLETLGEVLFFELGGALYIQDGERLYRYEGGTSVTAGEAYIPLLGNGWLSDTPSPGEVYESPNALTDKVCIRYEKGNISTALWYCCFDRPMVSIERVQYGATVVDPAEYRLLEGGMRLNFPKGVYVGNEQLVVWATLADPSLPAVPTGAMRWRGEGADRSFLYGGRDPSRLCADRAVSDASATGLEEIPYFPVYYPLELARSFGEGKQITALRRVEDRLLVFSESETYSSLDPVEEDAPMDFVRVTDSFGCTAPEGVAAIGDNRLLLVEANGVYCLEVDPALERDCEVKRVSGDVEAAWGADFSAHAAVCYVRRREEVWFADPSGAGEVFIYRPTDGCWYCFTGIEADYLLLLEGEPVFAGGTEVCAFDRDARMDEAAYGETEIRGVFRSHFLDFGAPESDKRLEGLLLLADLDGGTLEVRLSDGGYLAEFSVEGDAHPTFPYLYERHLRSGRFRFASLELRAAGAARQRIFGAKVFV